MDPDAYAGSVLAVSFAMTVAGQRIEFGINLFTAELLFAGAAVARLLQTVRQLAGKDRAERVTAPSSFRKEMSHA